MPAIPNNSPGPAATVRPVSPSEPNLWPQSAQKAAWIALAFCLVVLALLVTNYVQSLRSDPLTSPELATLKAELVKNPLDDNLKKSIRLRDLEMRRQLTRHQELGERGGWLLLGGMAFFVLAIKYGYYKKKLARPDKRPIVAVNQAREIRHAMASVGILTALAAGGGWVVSSQSETKIVAPIVVAKAAEKSATAPAAQPEPAKPAAVAAPTTPYPTADEIAKNWPRFRGPGGIANAAYTNFPFTWNVEKGENIAWKTPITTPGANSAVVWDNTVFITGANAKKREVSAYELTSGKILWQKTVETGAPAGTEPPNVMEDSGGFAPSTAVTDGRRVYAIFVTGDLAAFDLQGNPVWTRYLGRPDNSYGHASSLDFYQDRLIVLFDQGDGKGDKSKLLALETATGKTAWESKPRPVPNSWATPITIKVGKRDLIVACGNPWVMAYDAISGSEVWRAKALYGEVTPSPIYSAGLVLAVMDGENLSAIKPDGEGDVTKTQVAWKAEEGLPDITSPVADGEYVYLITSSGALTAYTLATGKKAYSQELELSFKSSPSIVGDRLLLIDEKGVAIWVQTGPKFKELGRCALGEEILASPAFLDGRMVLRGKSNLICVGKN
jgi:outer membrane protein assembly factor BamB